MFFCGWPVTWMPEGFCPVCDLKYQKLPGSKSTYPQVCLIFDVFFVFILKCNSIFHYTLATTTGGKDLGLQNNIETKIWLFFSFSFISCWFGLLCFCFFFFFHVSLSHMVSPPINHGSKGTETIYLLNGIKYKYKWAQKHTLDQDNLKQIKMHMFAFLLLYDRILMSLSSME